MSIHVDDEPMRLDDMIRNCAEDGKYWFPDNQTLPFLALCLAGEVGEVANLIKKVERGTLSQGEVTEELAYEMVDVLIYLCNMMGHRSFKDIDWGRIWFSKQEFNERRFSPAKVADINEIKAVDL